MAIAAALLAGACGAPDDPPAAVPATAAPRLLWDLPVVAPTTVAAAGVKRVTPVAELLPPAAGRRFVDSTPAVVQSWVGRLDAAPTVAAATGDVAGLDLFDDQRMLRARVFLFLPESELGADGFADLVAAVSEAPADQRHTVRLGGIDGVEYQDRNGTCFLGVDDTTSTGAVIWVVSDDRDDVRTAIDAFRGAALAG